MQRANSTEWNASDNTARHGHTEAEDVKLHCHSCCADVGHLRSHAVPLSARLACSEFHGARYASQRRRRVARAQPRPSAHLAAAERSVLLQTVSARKQCKSAVAVAILAPVAANSM